MTDVCSTLNCSNPAAYNFGTVDLPTGDGEHVTIGTVRELNPQLLEGLDAETAKMLGDTEVVRWEGSTEPLTVTECEDCYSEMCN